MSKCDRLDMLKIASLFDKYDNLSIFKLYIPNHYDEIYSLYSLLIESGIDYNNINFNEPSENNDGSFNINFTCSNEIHKSIDKIINKNKVIKYFRDISFEINSNWFNDDDTIHMTISFNKI